MVRDAKVALIGSGRAAALAEAVRKFGISVQEMNHAVADARVQMARFLISDDIRYGAFGKPRIGGRERPSKLLRRIKTTC